jgi:hypothetical protein
MIQAMKDHALKYYSTVPAHVCALQKHGARYRVHTVSESSG